MCLLVLSQALVLSFDRGTRIKKNKPCQHVKYETRVSVLTVQRFTGEVLFWPCCCPPCPDMLDIFVFSWFQFFVHFQRRSLVYAAL